MIYISFDFHSHPIYGFCLTLFFWSTNNLTLSVLRSDVIGTPGFIIYTLSYGFWLFITFFAHALEIPIKYDHYGCFGNVNVYPGGKIIIDDDICGKTYASRCSNGWDVEINGAW